MLLATDRGGFETLTGLLRTESFSEFKSHGLEIRAIGLKDYFSTKPASL